MMRRSRSGATSGFSCNGGRGTLLRISWNTTADVEPLKGETAVDIVLACQKVLGAYGCAAEYDMERYVRDIVCMPIVGGSSNMQRNNIANRLRLASE